MNIYLANPRGFCAGVDRAIEIVERALVLFSAPIYVRHEVVHNRYVVNNLREKGAIFVEKLSEIPDNTTVFSAPTVYRRQFVWKRKKEHYASLTLPALWSQKYTWKFPDISNNAGTLS